MKQWTVHLEGGPRRVNHAAIVVHDKIYSFGGYCAGDEYDPRRPMDVHVLCTMTLRWKLLPSVNSCGTPYQRYGHSAVAYGEDGYLWGGRNERYGAFNELNKYCTCCGKWSILVTTGNIPPARDGHSACTIQDKMYICGGYEEGIDRFSSEVYSFHFDSSTWTLLKQNGSPARCRDFHTAVGIGHMMYVFGGRGDVSGDMFTKREVYDNKIVAYNTQTNTWHTPVVKGTLPVGRRSHSAFAHNGKMYIFGGYNGQESTHLNDIYEYDPEQCRWSKVHVRGNFPCARRRHCCCMVNDRVFLFGGTSPSTVDGKNNTDVEGETELTDLSDLHILDLEPTLKTLAQMAVLKYNLDTSCLPQELRWEIAAITTPNCISRPGNSHG